MQAIRHDVPGLEAVALAAGPLRPDSTVALSQRAGPVNDSFRRDEILAEVFAESVRRHPEAVALLSGRVVQTYREVDAIATDIARGLLRAGLRPGHVAGLWMPRGPALLIAQIAIAKTGAAWLPFDADAPVDRIATCLADADAVLLLVDEAFRQKAGQAMPCPVRAASALVDAADHRLVDARALGATPAHPAYLIYTSGSTGVPKGIVISNANICHYLRAANDLYRIERTDVVFQGASVAFDLSMEEIWIPYLVGASLVVASAEMLGEVDKLPDLMTSAGVTVLDTVPTLLAMITQDIPSLRLIILGGEACPPMIAQRWCRPGRRLYNSYGPTETTVVATADEVRPGEPVTIGGPIANYTCYVVDEALHVVPRGVEGELVIGGPGVAQRYLGRPALTAEKFVANTIEPGGRDPVLYRSGDAVVMEAGGKILFRGRIDDQVKIRGFRVELGEIEARLAQQPGVAQCAVVLRTDDGIDQLVAFLVPERGAASALTDAKTLRSALRAELPPYMIPARYESVADLPRLSSGKADRKALKSAVLRTPVANDVQEQARTPTEALLLAAAQAVLPPQAVPFEADFFTDLGGHSLLAARFVSVLRQTPRLAAVTLQDMYSLRTLRALGAAIDQRAGAYNEEAADLGFEPPPLRRRFLCGLAQAAVLPIIVSLMTFQWLGVFISYMLMTDSDASLFDEAVALVGTYLLINIATLVIAIASKWLILGRVKPGRYPLWGTYYFRCWLVQRMVALTHPKMFQGSPAMRVFLRALGTKVGRDAAVGDLEIGAFDLVTIGDGASIGSKTKINNARVEGGTFIIGPATIGADCVIGTSCLIEENVVVGEGAELKDLTAIAAGGRVADWEVWDGSPGQRTSVTDPADLPAPAIGSRARTVLQNVLYAALLLVVPPLSLIPIFPAFWLFEQLDEWLNVPEVYRFWYLASLPLLAWPTSFALILLTVAFIVAIRWLVLPRVREGRYAVHSWFYVRMWLVALATEVTLDTLGSLSATVFMRGWYRMMGTKIGKDAEISTNLSARYDLIEIGEKSFIADEVMLGDEDVRRGWMTLRKLRTGARVFVGNDGVVPIGADIPDGALIGIKSKPPSNAEMSPGDTWFGTPAIKLPVRQRFDGGASWTYEAPRWKKIVRPIVEAVRISMPQMLFIVFGTWSVQLVGPRLLDGRYLQVAWLFVMVSVLMSLMMTLIVIAIKWLLMGRYAPTMQPMWSWWAMRTEAVGVLAWGLAGKVLLDHLRGTPFLPWMFRLFGCRFGQGVYMDMTDITEFDCVTVGDFCAINGLAALQTHLYEDRVMKVGRVTLGRGVTVGAGSTVLYDTHVGDYARLGPLTLVMKGESIPPHTQWHGSPAEPLRTEAPVPVEKRRAA